MPRKRASEVSNYDSDNGFVANDNDDRRPKAKRAKTSQTASAPGKGRTGKTGSKDKAIVGGGKVDGNGDAFWEVRSFVPCFVGLLLRRDVDGIHGGVPGKGVAFRTDMSTTWSIVIASSPRDDLGIQGQTHD